MKHDEWMMRTRRDATGWRGLGGTQKLLNVVWSRLLTLSQMEQTSQLEPQVLLTSHALDLPFPLLTLPSESVTRACQQQVKICRHMCICNRRASPAAAAAFSFSR